MTDQDNMSFKERYSEFSDYYDNNPVVFVEDMHPEIKLHAYQKILLNLLHKKEKIFYLMKKDVR